MKTPLGWVKDYVELDASPKDVADRLRMAGVEVESVEDQLLELEITANRADLLSMLGVGREVALLFGTSVLDPETS